MTDFPRSLPAFERRFPDEAACAEWLLERRWGSGFACPECGHGRFWRLGRKVLTLQCRACRRETSVPFRAGGEPARPGRSHEGRLLLAGAVEIKGKGPGRTRLAVIGDYSAVALGAFVAGNVAEGSTVVSDGWPGYKRLKDVKHDPRVVGDAPAHLVLPWVHRVFANAKRWALGVYHGLREKHLQAYLDEFVFRFNRRRTPHAAFDRLLGLGLALEPATYQMLVGRS